MNFETIMEKLNARPLLDRVVIAVVLLVVTGAVMEATRCDAKCELNRLAVHLVRCISLLDAKLDGPSIDCAQSLTKVRP